MLVDAALNGQNASLAITDIDWSLIVLFMGLFVCLNGFEQTGFPCELVKALEDDLQLTKFKRFYGIIIGDRRPQYLTQDLQTVQTNGAAMAVE